MKRGSREFRRFTWSGSPGRARMSGPESTECYPNFRRRTARTAHTNICRAGEGGVGAPLKSGGRQEVGWGPLANFFSRSSVR
jgi:hypothetical protein